MYTSKEKKREMLAILFLLSVIAWAVWIFLTHNYIVVVIGGIILATLGSILFSRVRRKEWTKVLDKIEKNRKEK